MDPADFRCDRPHERLRGTSFDIFGYTAERRMKRRLIGEYEAMILSLAERVTWDILPIATEIAAAAAGLIAGNGRSRRRASPPTRQGWPN